MSSYEMFPIAHVAGARDEPEDDGWGPLRADIVLDPSMPDDALDGLLAFSHVEVIFVFDQVDPASVVRGSRHPRNNPAWPRVGILAQRGRRRPNRLGATIVEVVGRAGRTLTVQGLDAIDGTPIVDIKPVMTQFLPRSAVRQPAWVDELMARYW